MTNINNTYILPLELEAGCDECARGTLIYDVVAACVVLPTEFPDDKYLQIKDSKKLSAKKREELSDYIKNIAITYGIGTVNAEEIDKINILNATMKAMHKAINQAYIKHPFNNIKIDGPKFNAYIPPGEDSDVIPHECIIKGDAKYLSIAAASIVAKNYHDKELLKLIDENPELEKYGLRKNMGYATKVHRDALKQYGYSIWHRKTFSSVK
jgi:ribonuclease HII